MVEEKIETKMDPIFIKLWMDMFRDFMVEDFFASRDHFKYYLFMVMLTLNECNSLLLQTNKEWWRLPRQNSFWNIVQNQVWKGEPRYLDMLYTRYYKMQYSLFEALLASIQPYIHNSTTAQYVREPVQAEKALCLALHRFGHGTSTFILSELYCVGESTVKKYTSIIINIIVEHLQNKYMVTPSGPRLQKIMNDFQSLTLLPAVCGALGGIHIKLSRAPCAVYNPKGYINRQKFHSVLLQGICDADKVFWNVCINAPGGSNNADHWNDSGIKKCMQDREILASPTFQIEGKVIFPYLLADSSYLISPLILKPFNTPNSELHSLFDTFVSVGQGKIESAFGILKGRWKILESVPLKLEMVPKLLVACCILHNYLQINGQTEPEIPNDVNPVCDSDVVMNTENTEQETGELQRDLLFREWQRKCGLSF